VFYARLAHCEFASGRFSEASRMSSMAAPLCEADGDAENAGYAFMLDEWSHLYLGDYDATFRLKHQVLRKMEEAFNLRWYHWAYAAASWANVCIGRWGEAIEDAEEELRIAEKFSDQSLISFANWNFCIAYTAKGDIARAMDYGERAVAKAPTPADRAYALGPLAWAWCRHGEPDRAIPKLAEIVGVIREAGWRPSENFSLYLGEAYLVAGELDKAQESLRTTLELAEECGMRFFVGSCHRLLGEVALRGASDRLVAAREHFERSIATLSEINAENELAAAYAGYGEALGRSSRITDARDYFTRAVDIFERLGTLLEPERIRTRLAALPAGDS